MLRHRLTDEEWDLISDLFPEPHKGPGRPPANPRDVLDGCLWILQAGAPWRDVPREFGSKSCVWEHFDRWNADGTLERVERRLRDDLDIDRELWCVDGTSVRAARCSGGGGKKGIRRSPKTTPLAAAEADWAAKYT